MRSHPCAGKKAQGWGTRRWLGIREIPGLRIEISAPRTKAYPWGTADLGHPSDLKAFNRIEGAMNEGAASGEQFLVDIAI